jgi:ParB family chromosome partitioning protein
MGHARALIGVPGCESMALMVEQKGLSVLETEQLVRKTKKGEDAEPKSRGATAGGKDADIAALEQHLADILGLKVEIADNGDGPGMLSLRYSTLDQLDMLCQRLSGERI